MTTPLKMYNLNVNVAAAVGGFFGLDGQCTTPRTPEILNSLIAMSNPFDSLNRAGQENANPHIEDSSSSTTSPLGSPTSNSPPSVQHTCSQLIKEGLKLTLQSKRKLSSSDSKDELDDFTIKKSKTDELTAEDEERRKRRRERNKIAATKCRMKKREKTANLVTEAEVLEAQNIDFKTQIQELEKQRRKLSDMLNNHQPHCVHNTRNTVSQQSPHSSAYDTMPSSSSVYTDPSYIDAFSDNAALHDFSKDPNFGKIEDHSYFPVDHDKSPNRERIAEFRGSFRCDDDTPTDVYHPNGSLEANFFSNNDSGYSSTFNASTQLHNGCLA